MVRTSTQIAPVAPVATCTPTRHVPVVNDHGKVISPVTHYGDGLDGKVECRACSQIIGEVDRKAPGGISWYQEGD